MTQTDVDLLEALIDAYGIARVLHELASLAEAKADHITSSWQDLGLAALWRSEARRVEKCAASSAWYICNTGRRESNTVT